jgi:magnesium chelatase family protein
VLFLDELPEFDRRVLEVLRQPMEAGCISISRAARQAEFPARFQLIAAMNPCPCGYLGHVSSRCHCSNDSVLRYQQRISGPLLDRINLHIEVAALAPSTLAAAADGEPSAVIAKRVAHAAHLQMLRQDKSNERLSTREIELHCKLDGYGEKLLRDAMLHLHWSGRAYHRVLKVARTIADLAGTARIGSSHVGEAIQLRRGLHESRARLGQR